MLDHVAKQVADNSNNNFTPQRLHPKEANSFGELEPPRLDSTGGCMTGADTPQHQIDNKHRQKAVLAMQQYMGEIMTSHHHLPLLWSLIGKCDHQTWLCITQEWATYGCPTRTGKSWTKAKMQEAVDHGPCQLALLDKAIVHFRAKRCAEGRQSSLPGTPSRMTHQWSLKYCQLRQCLIN